VARRVRDKEVSYLVCICSWLNTARLRSSVPTVRTQHSTTNAHCSTASTALCKWLCNDLLSDQSSCWHCKQLAPEWDQVANKLSGKVSTCRILLASVHCLCCLFQRLNPDDNHVPSAITSTHTLGRLCKSECAQKPSLNPTLRCERRTYSSAHSEQRQRASL
jgi:hypothetical protein